MSTESYTGTGNYRRTRPNFHKNRDYRTRYPESNTRNYDNQSNYSNQYSSRPYRRGGNENASVQGAFFLGNVDKQLTREEVYDFIKNETCCYICKFDMPNVPGDEYDKEGRHLKCAGFAFVHVKHQWMADEMLRMGKIRIGNLDAEVKPYDQMKREMSEQRYRQTSASQMSEQRYRQTSASQAGSQNSENLKINRPDESQNQEENSLQCQQNPQNSAHHLSTPRASTNVDWSEQDTGNYDPNDNYTMKIAQMGLGDWYLEDDSVYQTEDETASIVSAVNVNIMEPSSNSSSRPASRMVSPPNVRRKPKQGVSIPQNEIVGEITQKLLNDGITPTANKINEIATRNYNMNNIVQENCGSGKRESLETVINQNQNSDQNSMQHNMIVQTPISVGVPSLYQHNSFVIPATHIPYIQSPLHQTMEMLSQRLTSMDEYSAMIYAALVEQWTQFYATNPHEIANHIQRSQQEQETIMNQVVFDIQRQIPLSEQHIIWKKRKKERRRKEFMMKPRGIFDDSSCFLMIPRYFSVAFNFSTISRAQTTHATLRVVIWTNLF